MLRALRLKRRRSRVPWIYAVYHARERRLASPEGSGRFEGTDKFDPFEPP
jgi:hypothetical protein